MVIGNTCFTRNIDHPAIAQTLVKYCETDTVDTKDLQLHEFKYNQIACFESGDWPTYDDYISGVELEDFVKQEIDALEFESFPISSADSFFIDDRLLIGANYNYIKDAMPGIKKLIQFYTGKDISVELSMMDGHIDANFHPIKPGAIISLKDVQNYAQTFPGWDICYLPDQSWNKVKPFMKLKKQNKGKWWLAGEEDNAEFTNFVETWLQDWVGYVEETVFDVNVLMLDEHHCCVVKSTQSKSKCIFKKTPCGTYICTMEAQVLLGWRFALYYIRFIQRRKKQMLEKDKIYSLRLSDSSEIICKIVSTDSNETIISSPFSLIPTQQGVQLLPAMMSADETKNVTINTNNITMYTETNKDIIASYIQASTGIVTPTKGILKG